MENYFKRQIQLWGKDTQSNLQHKHILIIGCGGLGCSLGVALGSSGIGKITLVDFDEINLHNIHRQIAFTIQDINKNKAQVLKEHILKRNPKVEVKYFELNFSDFVSVNDNVDFDLILDATDNLQTRVEIDKFSKQYNIPWIYASVEEFYAQVCFFKNSSFESVFNINSTASKGIAAPMVMNTASFQANLAIRYLADLSVKKDMLYYMFFNDAGEFVVQKFKVG